MCEINAIFRQNVINIELDNLKQTAFKNANISKNAYKSYETHRYDPVM